MPPSKSRLAPGVALSLEDCKGHFLPVDFGLLGARSESFAHDTVVRGIGHVTVVEGRATRDVDLLAVVIDRVPLQLR